jgi:serine/threonine-protein kinase
VTDLREQLEGGLRDSYALERELGRGGMATVYLARDLKHDRPVALKVLHPELSATLGPERFQREIRLAARLQHPHILAVHDSGVTRGHLWFTMPFVEGESLRDRLRRERQLPVEDALRIAREAAQALQYAHEHGVVHRDIKPENLLLTRDGHTLVADFGIARALRAGGGVGEDERLTETGMAIGTPAYMSPEQASGERTLDPRTDIYSLAAVLYEMLAGETPFTGPTAASIVARRFTEPTPSVRRTRPSVPEAVDQAIQKALAPVPADRFATAAQFAQALQVAPPSPTTASGARSVASVPLAPPPPEAPRSRRLPVAAITLGLGFLIGLGVLFAWRRTHGTSTGEHAGSKVLAVLPFENLGDSADAYFADGVTDEIRTKLAQVTGLEVIARGSSAEFRHTSKSPQEIARDLGADYLLTGTVRWDKAPGGTSRVRVSPELVEARAGQAPRTRWAQPFDASLTDVFQVQADIAGKVASALDVALADSVRRELAAKPTENLAAYDAFLKGEAASAGMAATDPPSLRRAIGFYSQALALDSAFVPAWVELARAASFLYSNSTPLPAVAEQARQAADRARTLGPNRPESYLALGDYHGNVTFDRSQSLAAYEAGLRLAPNNVDLLTAAGLAEESMGRWESAVARFARAAALDPRSANTARRQGYALLALRRYAEAQPAIDQALRLAPTNLAVIEDKATLALAQGDLGRAQGIIAQASSAIDPSVLLPYFANYNDLYWVLTDLQQQQLLTLPVSAFDNDRTAWSIVRAQVYYLRGDMAHTRIWADSARIANEEVLRVNPGDGQRHVFLGMAHAFLGHKTEAIREGERGVALWPISRDAFFGTYVQHQLARIYILTGEPDKALDRLEPLLKLPYELSPAWLRIDPNFAPLKGNPRFEKLAAGR